MYMLRGGIIKYGKELRIYLKDGLGIRLILELDIKEFV